MFSFYSSGSVCLDVINQTWSPMYDLINIFDTFLPQLLLYPNPTDPLNNDAASLQLKSEEQYTAKIKEYVGLYASAHLPQSQRKNLQDSAAADEVEKNNAGAAANLGTNHSSDGGKAKANDAQDMDSSIDEIKQHDSELSETSDIEMLDIDDDEGMAEIEYQ